CRLTSPAPQCSPFPYTTLFRSGGREESTCDTGITPACAGSTSHVPHPYLTHSDHPRVRGEHDEALRKIEQVVGSPPRARGALLRSEEHTSELQSREKLVCRLLL